MSNETVSYKGCTIEIVQDPDPQNPRTEWDNLGTMICVHKRYNLGDKHSYHSSDYNSWDEFLADIEKQEGPLISLPMYMYDHSGITINTTGFSCPWDSGQLGFIYITKEKVRKEYGWKVISKKRREKILDYLRSEVQTYDDFVTGSVYGYVVKDAAGEEIHSCWGFYGYDHEKSGLMEAAKNEIDCHVEKPETKVA